MNHPLRASRSHGLDTGRLGSIVSSSWTTWDPGPVDVVLVDADDFHTFQPLLSQVATAGLGLHLVRLIGARNRVDVLVNWAWNHLAYDRGSRLIVDRHSQGAAPGSDPAG